MKNLLSLSMVLLMSFFLSTMVSAQTEITNANCSKEKSELCKKVCSEKASASVTVVNFYEADNNQVSQNEVVNTDCASTCDPNDCPPICQILCPASCQKLSAASTKQVKMVNIETLNMSGVPASNCSPAPSCQRAPATKPLPAKATRVALAQG